MILHIKELLKTHDCVIIPQLGGLIGHYEPARRNLASGVMAPPMKRIAFNQMLKQNDGLLIHHLAMAEGLSFDDATLKVEQFRQSILETLNQHGSFLFSGIGKLSYDNEQKLQFYPILKENLLLDTFALPLVVAQPVQRLNAVEKVESESLQALTQDEPVANREVAPLPLQPTRDGAWLFRAAAAIGLLFMMTTAMTSLMNKDMDYALLALIPVQEETYTGWSATVNESLEWPQPDATLYEVKPAVAIDHTTTVISTPSTSLIDAASKFHVIVGSFKDQTRMQREISNMTAKGFQTETLDGPSGFTRIGIVFDGGQITKSDALSDIRKTVNPDAWIIDYQPSN